VGIQRERRKTREGRNTEERQEYRGKSRIQRKAGIQGKARIQREGGNIEGRQEYGEKARI
jgi:hypothetical protein